MAAAPPDDASARLAQKVLAETGVTEGYCVVLGDGDGSLTSELVSRTDLEVLCAQPVTEQVAATRDALDKAGIYGTRATAHTFETEGLPYPEYFASLVVVGPGFQGDVGDAAGELYRILRPYGGVAYIANTTGSAEAFRSAGAPDAELATGDALVVTRGELPGAGGWTHQYADGGRSGCSSDTLVKWPLQLLWFGGPGPARMMSRHWRAPAPVATHGRMFISGQHSIIAVDAYTGRELWSTDLRGVARRAVYIGGGNVAVDSDSVYTALGGVFLRLDAETGQIRQTYGLPTESPRFALDEPKTFELEIDDEKSGTIALEATAEALRITLTTVDDTARWRGTRARGIVATLLRAALHSRWQGADAGNRRFVGAVLRRSPRRRAWRAVWRRRIPIHGRASQRRRRVAHAGCRHWPLAPAGDARGNGDR